MWISLCATGIPAVRDEILRQTFERDQLVATVVETAFCRSTNDTTAFELIALVDGLAHRLMLDTTTGPRRAVLQVLERALASATAGT